MAFEPTGKCPPSLQLLFDPVRIGPVTAPNRFYQVPHGTGMARAHLKSLARMRSIKAEGGWGVVCTEQCDFHPTSNHLRELQLWDDTDAGKLTPIVDGIHAHGSLAGIELSHNGSHVANLESRMPPLAPSSLPVRGVYPVTARAMTKKDLAELRNWHKAAVRRAVECGFDIVYVYAGHGQTLPVHFLSPVLNQRTDEYGGSLSNRSRLLRELLEDAREAADGQAAVALRFGADTLPHMRSGGEQEAMDAIAELAELPDLWDVTLTDFGKDGASSRSISEGHEERWARMVKARTSKPIVGVGWFTSPETMAAQVRNGNLDLVGAARASIADPHLPRKIREGSLSKIRPCIGCNICIASDALAVPLVCTQNPTMGEEWRRRWHPERTPSANSRKRVLIVGGGPAGIEASRIASERGHHVILAEAEDHLGGHVNSLAPLPGLETWRRVVDWRVQQLRALPVEIALRTVISSEDLRGADVDAIGIATGARWRHDGVGHLQRHQPEGLDMEGIRVLSPDQVLAGEPVSGNIVVYDDDHYFMGANLALLLASKGLSVSYVTPAPTVATFTQYTNEQLALHREVVEACISVHLLHGLASVSTDSIQASDVYTGRQSTITCDVIILVTGRIPTKSILPTNVPGHIDAHLVGDALAPGTLAAAVHNGHLYGRHLSTDPTVASEYRRESHV